MTQAEILQEVTVRTRIVFPDVLRVLLFGSRARGDAREDSDFDLLVVIPTAPPGPARGVKLRLALRGLGASFDVLVLTSAEFEHLQASQGWWQQAVLREAVVLHEAA